MIANAKFVEWLEEAMSAADDGKNKNLYFVYRKAMVNLKLEKEPLSIGQLGKVAGIGATIQKKLELKLRAFIDEGHSISEIYAPGLDAPEEVFMSQSGSRNKASTSQAQLASTENMESSTAPAPKVKKPRQPKQYMPAYRSGGYEILMALYSSYIENANQERFCTKSEIIALAQDYCDTSFQSGTGSGTVSYTAWSSMHTLVGKNLILKRGSPAKYCLSIDGVELAKLLWDKTETFQSSQQSATLISASAPTKVPVENSLKRRLSKLESTSRDSTSTMAREDLSEFAFVYLDSKRNPTLDKNMAAVRINPQDFSTSYKIRYHMSSVKHHFCNSIFKENVIPDAEGYLSGYLDDGIAPLTAPGLDSVSIAAPRPSLSISFTSSSSLLAPNSPVSSALAVNRTVIDETTGMSQKDYTPWPQQQAEPKYKLEWSGPPTILAPNAYEIVLLIDTRENRACKDKQFVQQFLERKKIRFETRILEVGDILWIAKSAQTELVLDFVIERKRLDDLVSSIKSGRFKEQKTRLLRSGLSNIWYLIEDFACSSAEAFGQDRERSAIGLTQIGDDVCVHRAKSFEDGMDFIMNVHEMLRSQFCGKTLYGIPGNILEKSTFLQLKKAAEERDKVQYCIPFGMFGELNTKTKMMTLHEMWFRQLLCLRGVSADKAMKIIGTYPTARSLMVAFEGRANEADKIRLLKSGQSLASKDNIGEALAKRIVHFFQKYEYDDEV